MLALFWICLIGSVFSYFLYPLVVAALAPRSREEEFPRNHPSVTLVITAYNEQARIDKKLRNSLELQYSPDKLEILVASDCSDDDTDSIVRSYESRGIRLVRPDRRLGKENAQGAAIAESTGEILVFSDVATTIPPDGLNNVVQEFDNPEVGAVSSVDCFVSEDGPAGEGAYVRYEMWLRSMESRLAGLVGMSGSFFAARREVCEPWDTGSPSDFSVALNCRRKGFRAVSSPRVLGYYSNIKDESKEYARKLRTILRGMSGLQRNIDVLNPFKFGLFTFQVLGHKIMRWLTPWFLLGLFAASALLAGNSGFVCLVLAAQIGFYGLAVLGALIPQTRRYSMVKIPLFFVVVNLAAMQAAVRFLRGERLQIWQPSER